MGKGNGRPCVPPLCRGCNRERNPGQYLCIACWFMLPNPTRMLLRLKDGHEVQRAKQLYDAIYGGVPLSEIEVSMRPQERR